MFLSGITTEDIKNNNKEKIALLYRYDRIITNFNSFLNKHGKGAKWIFPQFLLIYRYLVLHIKVNIDTKTQNNEQIFELISIINKYINNLQNVRKLDDLCDAEKALYDSALKEIPSLLWNLYEEYFMTMDDKNPLYPIKQNLYNIFTNLEMNI